METLRRLTLPWKDEMREACRVIDSITPQPSFRNESERLNQQMVKMFDSPSDVSNRLTVAFHPTRKQCELMKGKRKPI